jgi:hypothetical protein
MIISHKYKIIFFHCRKTGGSTIKMNLFGSLGPNDIMIGGVAEALAMGASLNRRGRLDLMHPRALPWYLVYRGRGLSHPQSANNAIKKRYAYLSNLPEHSSAKAVRLHFPQEFNNYFKFCFVRNPYTQIVSDYFWRLRQSKNQISFSTYLDILIDGRGSSFPHRGRISNLDIISIDKKICCDYVGKIETLAEDYSCLAARLGFPSSLHGCAKKGLHKSNKYGSVYGPGDRERVEQLFPEEISLFNYTWPY